MVDKNVRRVSSPPGPNWEELGRILLGSSFFLLDNVVFYFLSSLNLYTVNYTYFKRFIFFMSIATTYFIKAQIPRADINRLLELYKREILFKGAGYAQINGNVVEFSGGSSIRKYGNKFTGFSQGRLVIEETVSEFEVYLEADSPKWILLFDVYFTKLRNDLERELQEG